MDNSTKLMVLTAAAALAALAGGCEERAPETAAPTVSGPGMNGVTDSTTGTDPGALDVQPPVDDPMEVDPGLDEPPMDEPLLDDPALDDPSLNDPTGVEPDPLSDPAEIPPADEPLDPDLVPQDEQARIDAEREAENVAAREAAERLAADADLTPEMAELLGDLNDLGGVDITELEPAEARLQPGLGDAVAAWSMRTRGGMTPEEVGNVANMMYENGAGEMPVRVYWPMGSGENPQNLPVVVYWHGGGFVLADLNTYDGSARAISNAAGCIVVAPEYRHAPEAPFPAATEDAVAAYQWTVANAAQLGGDAARVAVAGESAGGNLAAVVSLTCREQGLQMPVHQVLIYPVGDWTFDSASFEEHADAKPLNRGMMEWFKTQYLGTEAADIDWRAAPLRAESFGGMPPTTIITAEVDPLRSDGEMLAARLEEDGVAVNFVNYVGVTHEFFGAGAVLPEAREAVQVVAADLRNAFGGTIGGVETDGE